ncbi:CHAD domain-containing protein, partial [Bacteroides fragilis]|nr:CHAD domain-containing protein [Bacteroides fragilis]
NEWDSVHQMRVATRELRSHIQTFHGIVVGPEIERIESELKLLAGILGVARDAEVVEERWQSLLASEDSDTLDEATREHISRDMGNEWDSVHQMRVATRELRSHIQTFHGIVVGPEI